MVTFANRAKVSTSTTGTGTITLGTAVDGYQSFTDAGVVNSDVVRYTIEDGEAWEIGSGTYSAGTLTRVLDESSTGSLLNLSGDSVVYVTAAGEDLQLAADMDQGVATTDDVAFSSVQLTGGTGDQGTLSWNADEETLDLIENGTTLQIGQEVVWNVRNNSGSTIADGTPVMATGTIGASGRITVAPMDGTDADNVDYFLGVATEEIADGADGKVTHFGKVRGLDTSGFSEGDVLFISTTTAGQFTNVEPTSGLCLPVAFVISSHASAGTIAVRVKNIDKNAFATAAQGALADSAVQPNDSPSFGSVTVSGTVDGRDVAADGSKLDGIEAGANVTDTANVTAAGALMDSEVTNLAQVKAFDSADYATAAQGSLADSAVQPNDSPSFGSVTVSGTVDGRDISADGSKLDGIEVGATADQTAGEILTSIKTVDGSGSGLDADLLDGIHASSFLQGNQTITLSGDVSGSGTTSISVTVADDSHNHVISNVDGLQAALDAKLDDTQKGAANGLAELDATGKVPSAQLPSYVDDVLEYADAGSFPATGEAGKLYVALDNNDVYRWTGSAYVKVSDAVSTADQATRLATARNIALSGDVSGSANFDGSANISITATVADDSHNHIIGNVDGLQTALDGKLSTTGKAADSNLLDGLDSTAFYLASNPNGYTTNVGDITGVTAGTGLSGGGTSGTVTISHADTSSQGSVNNSGATVIQDVTLDTYGHVTGLGMLDITPATIGAATSAQGALADSAIQSGDSPSFASATIGGVPLTNFQDDLVINNGGLQLDGGLFADNIQFSDLGSGVINNVSYLNSTSPIELKFNNSTTVSSGFDDGTENSYGALHYNGSSKIKAASNGVDVVGTMIADSLSIGGNVFANGTSFQAEGPAVFESTVTSYGTVTANAFVGDGSGLTNLPAAGLANVVEDTTPQLGGTLDTNGNSILDNSGVTIGVNSGPTTTFDFNGVSIQSGYGRLAAGWVKVSVNNNYGTNVSGSIGGIQRMQLQGNITLNSQLVDGESVLLAINDGAGYTITWPTMTWVNNGGVAPTLETDKYTIVALWEEYSGLHGAYVGVGASV